MIHNRDEKAIWVSFSKDRLAWQVIDAEQILSNRIQNDCRKMSITRAAVIM